MIDPNDLRVDIASDKPKRGMWHTGPNPCWVTVTHLPTMISARAFDNSQHRAREAAWACVEMMVEQSRCERCSFPENVAAEGEASHAKNQDASEKPTEAATEAKAKDA